MENKEIINPFISHLLSLRDHTAAMAAFRRGLAHPPGEYIPQFEFLANFLSEGRNDMPYFIISSLFALHPENTVKGNLGDAFRKLEASPATEERFKALLQCRASELPVLLRGAVSLLAAKSIPINYTELLSAVKKWEQDNKNVQKKWAISFWAPNEENSTTEQTNNTNF
ncbi:MAG: type I-E CRISPR-associated protein Cse2/CasB [Ignavibacteria bacterium]|nr:type I-E CRISPR-associated protein Cse2/CasB [Ignavibacteria bacterium]